MIDSYIKSTDEASLRAFCAFFTHVIGPSQGTAAGVDGEGNAYPAKGDPAYFYACVRGPVAIPESLPIEVAGTEEGIQVCGVWA